jgi:hypothetical protein
MHCKKAILSGILSDSRQDTSDRWPASNPDRYPMELMRPMTFHLPIISSPLFSDYFGVHLFIGGFDA